MSNALKVTKQDIEANIASEHYFTAFEGAEHDSAKNYFLQGSMSGSLHSLSLLTFCVLVLKNGFTVTGESACVSPENFDAEIGRTEAYKNAVEKIWPLMGFALKQKLYETNAV